MPQHRNDIPDAWHHVMSRGIERKPIFFSDDDRILFGQLLGDIHERYGVEIHAYCLMGNHFHLLLRCPRAGLSDSMHHLLSVFARRVNERAGRWGHLFGGRFQSRHLTTHSYIANVVRYIHRNPLDVAGVEDPADYRWSSHLHYLRQRTRPDWLFIEPVACWFDGPEALDAFVSGSPDRHLQACGEANTFDADDFFDTIGLVSKELTNSSPRHLPAQRRAVAIELLPLLSDRRRDEVLAELGLTPGSGALRSARTRSRALARSEPVVRDMARRVALLLGIDTGAAAA